MKQITLHVYQSIDGCPVIADKCFNAAVDACAYVLIDEETYLRIYLNDLDWPLEAKETLVVTNGCIDLTETERVRFVRGNVVTELRRIKENGDGMVVAYGGETGALLLDNGLADEIVVTTVPVLVGNGEKGLECGPNDGRIWAVRSSEVLEDGKIRDFPCGYQKYRSILEHEAAAKPAVSAAPKPKKERTKGGTKDADKLVRRLEREIEKQEQVVADFDRKIEAASADYQELTRLLGEKEEAEAALMDLMEQWEQAQA